MYLLITGLYRKNCKFIFYVNFHFCRAGIRPALDFIIIDKKILNNFGVAKECDDMKKMIGMITLLLLMMGVVGCNGEKVNIDFPFEVGEVENIEMYHYTGVPVSAEKKVVVAETDITDLYDKFEDLSLMEKQVEETTGGDVTSFRFNLSDGTSYELIYVCNGVKNGNLKSSTGKFEYFTRSDIGSYWSNIDLEAVSVEENELPKLTN